MPTLEQNKEIWDGSYDWSRGGEEWSAVWGSTDAEWQRALLPRIRRFVPAPVILEIAPGFGRWTQYLRHLAERLVVVDLAEKCIAACRQRFADARNIEYHITDGRSLAMVDDSSVDFVFSFDSLVHASSDVMKAYVTQLGHKLSPQGVGFIHHSNTGAHAGEIRAGTLTNDSFRDETTSAELFVRYAESAGLSVIGQEILAWGEDRRLLSDCISMFTVTGSRWERANRIAINPDFMDEARCARQVSTLYHE